MRFSTAPVQDVAPKRKQRQPSLRAQTHAQYRDALHAALAHGQALVAEMEPEDKALTIRNRVKRAAEYLGIEDIVIRRRGNRILAYRSTAEDELRERELEAAGIGI